MKNLREKVEAIKLKKLSNVGEKSLVKEANTRAKILKVKEKIEAGKFYKVRHAQFSLAARGLSEAFRFAERLGRESSKDNVGGEVYEKFNGKIGQQLGKVSGRFRKQGRLLASKKKIQTLEKKANKHLRKYRKVSYKKVKIETQKTTAYKNATFSQKMKMRQQLKRDYLGKRYLNDRISSGLRTMKKAGKAVITVPKKAYNFIKYLPKNTKNFLKKVGNAIITTPRRVFQYVRQLPRKIFNFIKNSIIHLIKRGFFYAQVGLGLLVFMMIINMFMGIVSMLGGMAGGVATTTYSNNPEVITEMEEEWLILEAAKEKEIEELPKKYLTELGYDEFNLLADEEFAATGVSHDPHLIAAYMNAEFGMVTLEDVSALAKMRAWTNEYFPSIYRFIEKPSTRVIREEYCFIDEKTGQEHCELFEKTIRTMNLIVEKKKVREELDGVMSSRKKETREFYEALRGTLGNMPELFDSIYQPEKFVPLALKGKNARYNYVVNRGTGKVIYNPNASPYGATGHCTSFCYDVLAEKGVNLQGMGHAKEWAYAAAQKGMHVDRTVNVGDVAVFSPGIQSDGVSYGRYGHVAMVTAVYPDGSFEIAEMNGPASHGGGLGVVNTRRIEAVDGRNAQFITP